MIGLSQRTGRWMCLSILCRERINREGLLLWVFHKGLRNLG